MKNPFVKAIENDGEADEPNHGANNAEETDDAKIFKEQRFTKAIACRENDGRQNDCEKELTWKLKIFIEGLHKRECTYLAKIAVRNPMMMATVDSCR